MNRNLDGCYFRVQRDDVWENVCFSDLTEAEQDAILTDRSNEWLQSLWGHLQEILWNLGFLAEMSDVLWKAVESDTDALKQICKTAASTIRFWGDVLDIMGN